MKCLRNAKDDGGRLQVNIQDHGQICRVSVQLPCSLSRRSPRVQMEWGGDQGGEVEGKISQ